MGILRKMALKVIKSNEWQRKSRKTENSIADDA
jgi:hypothetical protein